MENTQPTQPNPRLFYNFLLFSLFFPLFFTKITFIYIFLFIFLTTCILNLVNTSISLILVQTMANRKVNHCQPSLTPVPTPVKVLHQQTQLTSPRAYCVTSSPMKEVQGPQKPGANEKYYNQFSHRGPMCPLYTSI